MSMYTEFHFNANLRDDTSENVMHVLKAMTTIERNPYGWVFETPDHPLFKTQRWEAMLNSDSYYFPSAANSVLNENSLSIRCNFRNYDNEIDHFLDWIAPYLDEFNTFLGYSRYEEKDNPTLYFYDPAGSIKSKEVSLL